MTESDQYRYEFKYICTEQQMAVLEARISQVMELDQHARASGGYRIRSLYLDDYNDRCFYENEAGTDPREKYRIRIYNSRDTEIHLEVKGKKRGKTLKSSCLLTREQCEQFMRGHQLGFHQQDHDLLKKMVFLQRQRLLQPKIIVEYDRVPYVCRNGNVRVTFDKNISSSHQLGNFLAETVVKRPVLPAGQHVLEVKYDEHLPEYIEQILQTGALRQTAFSKYYLCRCYRIHGRSQGVVRP